MTDNADLERAADLLLRAGYQVIPPVEPDEEAQKEMAVASTLATLLGPPWRRSADNALEAKDGNILVSIVVRCYRQELRIDGSCDA